MHNVLTVTSAFASKEKKKARNKNALTGAHGNDLVCSTELPCLHVSLRTKKKRKLLKGRMHMQDESVAAIANDLLRGMDMDESLLAGAPATLATEPGTFLQDFALRGEPHAPVIVR